ncbi:MAG TPA: hypothetical protein PKK36_05450 [Kiritimatiellia bacterium]|nr:hypothetical protein [Kiritimatiellia bacterium]
MTNTPHFIVRPAAGWYHGRMLEEIYSGMQDEDIPHYVDVFIDEAESRINDFLDEFVRRPVSRFLPSDHRLVFHALQRIRREQLAPGNRFCEWGCGFGVATGIAAMLGFEAFGIEIDPRLVSRAGQLMKDFELAPTLCDGSYIPQGFDFYTDGVGQSMQLIRAASDENARGWYRDWNFSVESFDVIFVYPWPSEEEFVEQLFDATAAEGALLVIYRGLDDISIKRRVAT